MISRWDRDTERWNRADTDLLDSVFRPEDLQRRRERDKGAYIGRIAQAMRLPADTPVDDLLIKVWKTHRPKPVGRSRPELSFEDLEQVVRAFVELRDKRTCAWQKAYTGDPSRWPVGPDVFPRMKRCAYARARMLPRRSRARRGKALIGNRRSKNALANLLKEARRFGPLRMLIDNELSLDTWDGYRPFYFDILLYP